MGYRDELAALRERVAILERRLADRAGEDRAEREERGELIAQKLQAELRAQTAEAELEALRQITRTEQQAHDAEAQAQQLIAGAKREQLEAEVEAMREELELLRELDPARALAHYRERADAAYRERERRRPPTPSMIEQLDDPRERAQAEAERRAAAEIVERLNAIFEQRLHEAKAAAGRLNRVSPALRRAVLRAAVEPCPECTRFVDAIAPDSAIEAVDGRYWNVRPFPTGTLRAIYGAEDVEHECGVWLMRQQSDGRRPPPDELCVRLSPNPFKA